MNKRVLLITTALYIGTLGALALALLRAAPSPPSATIRGVAIGDYGRAPGIAFISGNRFACGQLPQPAAFDTQCELAVAGKPLKILARANSPADPDQFGGACEAQYNGRSWPCRIGMRHVHVDRFAYINDTLGLSFAQFDQLRRAYPIENLPQEIFLPSIGVVALLSTLLAAAWATSWLWSRWRYKPAVLFASSAIGVAVFLANWSAALALTRGFWD